MTDPAAAPIAVKIGNALRQRRTDLHLSQAEVANKIGRTQTWLSYLEAGKRNPRLSDLDALLRELSMALTLEHATLLPIRKDDA